MPEEDLYKNRDIILGEIREGIKDVKSSQESIKKWCEIHDKKDDKRFIWGGIALFVVAGATGVLPQLFVFVTDHLK